MDKVLLAIGLVLAVEGTLYALFPSFFRYMVKAIETLSDWEMRRWGVISLSLGVFFVWLAT